MPTLNRRELLQSLAVTAAGASAASLLTGAPSEAAGIRISGYEVIPLRVPMDIRVREAWQKSWSLQNRYQTHHEPVLVKLKTDSGIVGIADSMMTLSQTKDIAESMLGRSPWEFLFDDSFRGILVAVVVCGPSEVVWVPRDVHCLDGEVSAVHHERCPLERGEASEDPVPPDHQVERGFLEHLDVGVRLLKTEVKPL